MRHAHTVSGNRYQGAAYVFARHSTAWIQRAELAGTDGATEDQFGWSVALSSDGNTGIIGADNKRIGPNMYQGAAYVFALSASIPVTCVGDCNGDALVTVDEILVMVNIAIGAEPVQSCVAGDANGDGFITVDEILAAVNNALNGCGA